jgi:hypothetical protein
MSAIQFYERERIADAWASASARSVSLPNKSWLRAYAQALQSEYANGTVAAVSFALDLEPSVVAMAAHPENWKYAKLPERIWRVRGVLDALPPIEPVDAHVERVFEPTDVYWLVSFLARTLHVGGAYSRTGQRGRGLMQCFELAGRCVEELLDEFAMGFVAEEKWCGFFMDVAWDKTVVVISPKISRVHILLATDTD